jgi:5-methylcytosine-specific restriction endonuclease McrA
MNRKEYIKEYQRNWMKQRRLEWVNANGPCKSCGSDENLEVDHIDPSLKRNHVSRLWSCRVEVREKELAKCQVLCYNCHLKKTISEISGTTHGTYAMRNKYGCSCEICKEYVREDKRKSRARIKARNSL